MKTQKHLLPVEDLKGGDLVVLPGNGMKPVEIFDTRIVRKGWIAVLYIADEEATQISILPYTLGTLVDVQN